ncbi:MAG: hypothetical protein Q8Q46_02535 [Candidatus Giovannonibacteria bacterium]|nr:hypothetical protein [Candidatus Giovannonibacteria bacterium]
MEKKYFTISLVLNALFYISAVSAPFLIEEMFPNYLFGESFVSVMDTILLIILVILPAVFGVIYLFFAENKKWVILGLMIDFFTLLLLFLIFWKLQSSRNI